VPFYRNSHGAILFENENSAFLDMINDSFESVMVHFDIIYLEQF
jgi:hypothetical protein